MMGSLGMIFATYSQMVQKKRKCIYGENDKANVTKYEVLINLAKGIQEFFVLFLYLFYTF